MIFQATTGRTTTKGTRRGWGMAIQRYRIGTTRVGAAGHRGVGFIVSDTGEAVMHADHVALTKRLVDALEAARALADAMETCHECKGTVLVEEQPVHCEDCSSDCESHEGAECPTIYGLHLALKLKLARVSAE